MNGRKSIWVLIVTLSVFCLGLLFGCGAKEPTPPEVTGVTLTAAEGAEYGKTGEKHLLGYTAPEDSTVTFSVLRGESPATAADYACVDGAYIFYAEGEYTVTVYAAKDGVVGSASAKISIAAREAFVKNVTLTAAKGETAGKAGTLYFIGYEAPAGSEVAVAFEKDGAPTEDVIFAPENKTVVFCGAGEFTVTVSAAYGGTTAQGSASVAIAVDPLEVALTSDRRTVTEESGVVLQKTVSYALGDSCETEEASVFYRRGTSGEFRLAEEETYALEGDLFTPHVAGEWRIDYKATSRFGASGEASVRITSRAAALTLKPSFEGRMRIRTNTPVEIGFLVTGAADKYNVSFDTHGHNVVAEKAEGNAMRLTAAAPDAFTVTVTYAHKVTSSQRYSIDLDFYSVDDLTYAPAWGEDPFGGMPGEVLSSMGHLFTVDAKSCGGLPRTLTAANASFEVTASNISADGGDKEAQVLYAADDPAHPYILVNNFGNNTAHGTFTVKMTLTDPDTGYAAVAYKDFTVLPTGNTDAAATKTIADYVERYASYYNVGAMNFTSDLPAHTRENMVLTREGVIMHRTNGDFALNGGNSDFARIDASGENIRLEFRFELFGVNPTTSAVGLGIGLRTGNNDGWAGFFDLTSDGTRLQLSNSLDSGAVRNEMTGAELPLAQPGTVLYLRLDRTVSETTVVYTLSFRTQESGYTQYMRSVYTKTSSAGNPGAPVAQLQFTHRNGGGCYAVEEVRLQRFA